jgi:hypothetical protein
MTEKEFRERFILSCEGVNNSMKDIAAVVCISFMLIIFTPLCGVFYYYFEVLK